MDYIRDIIVLISDSTPGSYIDYLRRYGYSCLVSGSVSVDLRSGVELLGKSFGIKHIWVDSAGRLAGAFFAQRAADELHPILSPFVSSSCALPVFTGPIEDIRLRLLSSRKIKGGNVLLKYAVCD